MPIFLLLLCLVAAPAHAQAPAVADYTALATHGDIIVTAFVFHTGERLPELRLHYVTWGTPRRGAGGEVVNAVLLLHGTLGDGVGWGRPVEGEAVHPLLGPGGGSAARGDLRRGDRRGRARARCAAPHVRRVGATAPRVAPGVARPRGRDRAVTPGGRRAGCREATRLAHATVPGRCAGRLYRRPRAGQTASARPDRFRDRRPRRSAVGIGRDTCGQPPAPARA